MLINFPLVSRETNTQLNLYVHHLLKWNQTHNLMRSIPQDPDEFYLRHFADTFALTKHMNQSDSILDIGSGNGVPGIILSVLGYNVDLCEIDIKKVSFLKFIKSELGLSCRVLGEDVYGLSQSYHILVSRAFSSLKNLVSVQKNVSCETFKTKGLYLKGERYKEEIEEVDDALCLVHPLRYGAIVEVLLN